MNSPTHTIDPDGEVIIILLDANSPFAQLEKNTSTSLDSDNSSPLCDNAQDPPQVTEVSEYPLDEPEPTAKQKKMMRKMKKMKKQPGTIQAALELTSSSQEIAANDAPVEAPAVEDPPAEEPAAGEATTEEPTTTEDPAASEDPAAKDPAVEEIASEESFTEVPVQSCFRIQVSAKHLIFASPVFKKILTGGFKESITYLQKGSVEITAETWDIDALIIVLQAIHGQHYLTPQELTLEMLAKVAVIADYYECKNALYLLADMWIKKMEQDIPTPTITPRDLILWLWIAWFFRLHYIFKLSTSIAISQSDGWIDSLGLPIPGNVIGSINECREEPINNLIVLLHETRDAFLNGTRGCSFECCSIMYGALTKHMQSNNLLSPKPETPFLGLNHKSLAQKAMTFISPKWHTTSSGYSSYGSNYRHSCDHSSFSSVFAILQAPLEGLELDRFTSS